MMPRFTIFAAFFCLLGNSIFGLSDGKNKKTSSAPDQDVCLQISGDLDGSMKIKGGNYIVKLIQNNQVIQQTEVDSKSTFRLNLKRNREYTIRIEKEGYIPRLISVNTALPENVRKANLYRFHFDMQLFAQSFAKYFDSDDIDFPIALIAYDKSKGVFHYDKNYTTRIQQKMHSMSSTASKE
jgi:hypothetical protein